MKIIDRLPGEKNSTYVLRLLRHNIIYADLAPGTPISENELASQLSMSRTPVREALIQLQKDGLVEVVPQRGSYVSLIDYNAVEESRFVRVTLEVAVLKLACQHISEEYLAKLDANLEKQRAVVNKPSEERTFYQLDNEFHELLFASQNKVKTFQLIQQQSYQFDRLRALAVQNISQEKVLHDHEDIVYAIRRKDAQMAEMLMTRHLARHLIDKEELEKKYPDYFVPDSQ